MSVWVEDRISIYSKLLTYQHIDDDEFYFLTMERLEGARGGFSWGSGVWDHRRLDRSQGTHRKWSRSMPTYVRPSSERLRPTGMNYIMTHLSGHRTHVGTTHESYRLNPR